MADWEPITTGMSGDIVQRRAHTYRKTTPNTPREVATLTWLRAHGIPTPEIVDTGDGWFDMAEIPGRDAAAPWPAHLRPRIVDALADLARALHALPADACPFDRALAVTMAEAEAAATSGRIDLDDLDDEHAGWSAARLLDELRATRPATEDLVVTHGDLCVPNVLFDPETAVLTGVIDTARAGRADRYVDLAIATRSLAADLNPQYGPPAAARFLRRYGVDEPDRAKIAFYRLMDEFA